MVLPNVLCALNFASSLMMNGACCYYQMQEEDSRRKHQEDSIQKAIQKELDMRQEQEMKDCERRNITSHFESERRRKLMAQKQSNSTLSKASTFSTGWGKASELSSLIDEDSQVDEVELEEIMLE